VDPPDRVAIGRHCIKSATPRWPAAVPGLGRYAADTMPDAVDRPRRHCERTELNPGFPGAGCPGPGSTLWQRWRRGA